METKEHQRSTLTNAAIAALQPGQEIRDTQVPGLSVRAFPTGKSFYVGYRIFGQRRRPKLGDVGGLTIEAARSAARKILARVALGEDPSHERREARSAPTFGQAWERARREHWNGGSQWDKEAARIWDRYLAGPLARKQTSAMRYDDLARIHESMADRPFMANRVVAVAGKVLDLCEKWGYRPEGSNPTRHISRYSEPGRRRYATPDEMAKVGAVLEREAAVNPSGVAFLWLLILSGARPSEIERATWDQLEPAADGCGVLRIQAGKTGQRNVFLPAAAMEVIARLPRGGKTIIGRRIPRDLWEKIREEVGAKDLWLRDWRRTFATVALSAGVSSSVLGELLGHRSAQTTKIYAKLMEDPALSTAQNVAGRMQALVTTPRSPNPFE